MRGLPTMNTLTETTERNLSDVSSFKPLCNICYCSRNSWTRSFGRVVLKYYMYSKWFTLFWDVFTSRNKRIACIDADVLNFVFPRDIVWLNVIGW